MRVRTPIWTAESKREYLNWLNGTKGLSWAKISRLRQYSGIPFGTLATFANGGPIPKKWRHQLGLDTPRDLFSYSEDELRDMIVNREEWSE